MTGASWPPLQMSPRDHALGLMFDRDLEAQLIAIKVLLRRHSETEKETQSEIEALDKRIRELDVHDEEYHQHLEGLHIDRLHASVFEDAAHSMSAVGMLAPFVEAVFVAIFEGLRGKQIAPLDNDARPIAQSQYWNPRYVWQNGKLSKNIVGGISQLATSTGVHGFMPKDYSMTLSALFSYRNAMFHNGLEWPPEERQKFAERIKTEGWPEGWFLRATTNDQPWVFYMSEAFIAECLNLIDQVLDGVGRYLEQGEANQS